MYYFIVNPGSRSGRGKAVWQIVEGILEREKVEYRVFFTAYRYHATKLAREITSQKEKLTLVTVGGDGTVNEVVDGIQDFSRVTFGYIPTGSSNDFARSLRLPSAPEAALYNIQIPPFQWARKMFAKKGSTISSAKNPAKMDMNSFCLFCRFITATSLTLY